MTSVARVCSVEGCDRKHYARGVCNPHYQRQANGQPTDTPLRAFDPGRGCQVPTCDRPHGQNGYCQAHNKRFKGGRSLNQPLQQRGVIRVCRVSDCTGKHVARGMCAKHDKVCRNFNLTVVQYQMTQDMGCQICGAPGGGLHIDHAHTCCPERGKSCGGCIRGGLCPTCNVGLGMFGDNVVKLQAAIIYLAGESDKLNSDHE